MQELSAIAGGWALALRTAQIREESRALTEQLAETNRRLQSAQNEVLRARMMITRRRDGGGRGARDEQSAGRHQRPITVAGRRNYLTPSTRRWRI